MSKYDGGMGRNGEGGRTGGDDPASLPEVSGDGELCERVHQLWGHHEAGSKKKHAPSYCSSFVSLQATKGNPLPFVSLIIVNVLPSLISEMLFESSSAVLVRLSMMAL